MSQVDCAGRYGLTHQELSYFEPFCPRPGFQKRLGQRLTTVGRIVSHHDFAEFFAELCAEEAPIVPLRSPLLR